MERDITHSCGHVERHYVGGMLAANGDIQARRLARMKCKPCYTAGKRTKAAQQAETDAATLAGVELPALTGSDKQVAWAMTLRLASLAALYRADAAAAARFVRETDAKWWIDHRSTDLASLPGPARAAA